MQPDLLAATAAFFDLPAGPWRAQPLGNGLINRTYLLDAGATLPRFVAQQINVAVFKRPQDIDTNLRVIAAAHRRHFPDALFVGPLANRLGDTLFHHAPSDAWVRVLPHIENSVTHDTVPSPNAAYEAACQFGLFASRLQRVPNDAIVPSIPNFHNLGLREQQFAHSLGHGNPGRIAECSAEIKALRAHSHITTQVETARQRGALQTRLMHHDTKISNVLFDAASGKALCAIDLDTVMPGTYLSDVGDMMRTYLCPFDENHTALADLHVRADIYRAIASGYMEAMRDTLSADERALFPLAGSFMLYMQALRFLTDHFNNDVYYGARHPGQNLERARNQIRLLQRYVELTTDG